MAKLPQTRRSALNPPTRTLATSWSSWTALSSWTAWSAVPCSGTTRMCTAQARRARTGRRRTRRTRRPLKLLKNKQSPGPLVHLQDFLRKEGFPLVVFLLWVVFLVQTRGALHQIPVKVVPSVQDHRRTPTKVTRDLSIQIQTEALDNSRRINRTLALLHKEGPRTKRLPRVSQPHRSGGPRTCLFLPLWRELQAQTDT